MWRSVIIYNGERLNIRDEWLVVTMEDGSEKKLPLEDLNCVVIDNHNLTLSVPAIAAFGKYKINVVFTDDKHMPCAELYPINGSYRTYGVVKRQIEMSHLFKGVIWRNIIIAKINNQALVLDNIWSETEIIEKLRSYALAVVDHDLGNREAVSAKLFFRELYGSSFIRFEDDTINAFINYGYAIIRSCVAKSLISHGFNCAIGVHHISETNAFNLADDFIEPLRPLVDQWVYCNLEFVEEGLSREAKSDLVNLVNQEVLFDGKHMKLRYAVDHMVQSFIRAIELNNPNKIILPQIIYQYEK